MSLSKHESEVKHLAVPAQTAYELCSDLRNLAPLKEKLNSPEAAEKLAENNIPTDKLDEIKNYIKDVTFEPDALHLATSVGDITLRIVESDPKCIKFAGEGTPIPVYLWIQILPETDATSKMRVTVGAEVSFFMKGMVSKPLQQAADGLATILAAALSKVQ